MGKRRKHKKKKSSDVEVWTEEQYEEYMKGIYEMDFIAGYTSNGVPYGIYTHECDYTDDEGEPIIRKNTVDADDELPF